MQSTIRKALPAALSVALVAGALAVPAIATTDDDTTDDTTTQEMRREGAHDDRPHRHRLLHAALHDLEEGELAERLAAELGLDADTVQEALDAVRLDLAVEQLDDAVEAGRLTQDQADRIAAAINDGTLGEVLPQIRLEKLEERLDEKVEAGELTQEEADQILEDAENGDWPGRDRRRDHRPRRGATDAAGPDAANETAADESTL